MSDKNNKTFMLTTLNNPHNPFTEWEQWLITDIRLGYNTCGLISRICKGSDSLDDDADLDAMRTIVLNNWSGKHVMVTEDTFEEIIRPALKTDD